MTYIQCMQHLKNSAKCNLHTLNLEMISWEKTERESKELSEKDRCHCLKNIHLNKETTLPTPWHTTCIDWDCLHRIG